MAELSPEPFIFIIHVRPKLEQGQRETAEALIGALGELKDYQIGLQLLREPTT